MGLFETTIIDLCLRAHRTAQEKGFWSSGTQDVWKDPDRMLSLLMLTTTEVAEAAEAVRHNDIENFGEELADICIRIFDISYVIGIDLEKEILKKMDKNDKRPTMHGGKRV